MATTAATLVLTSIAAVLISLVYRRYESLKQSYVQLTENSSIKKILFVVAHPDDECMFFGPAILRFKALGKEVKIACLSTGDWYSQGRVRVSEFARSCQLLGVGPTDRFIINERRLADDPTADWAIDDVSKALSKIIDSCNGVDGIVTFDALGVSGHRNHISIHAAVAAMDLPGVSKFELESVSLPRKYLSVLDIALSLAFSPSQPLSLLLVTPYADFLMPAKAMFAHKSQLMWFRYLYIVFSRYMLVNTLIPF